MWARKMQWRLVRDILEREMDRLLFTLSMPGTLSGETVKTRLLLPFIRDMRQEFLTPIAMRFYMKCVNKHKILYDEWRKETQALRKQKAVDKLDGNFFPFLASRWVTIEDDLAFEDYNKN